MINIKNNNWTIQEIVLTGLFTALTVIGTSIRVPLPALVGNPFFHFGLPILSLAVLTLGYFKGSLAGGIGFAIFDVLNGFAAEAPYFIFESFIVGGALALSFKQFNKQKNKYWFIPFIMTLTSLVKILMTFLKNLVLQLIMGNNFSVSAIASASSLYITVINAIAAIIIVSILYQPISKLSARFIKEKGCDKSAQP